VKLRYRFGLRRLFVLIALVCISLWAIPAATDWYYWRRVRAIVIDTMADLAMPSTEPSVFLGVANQSEYYLSNHEIKWDSSLGAMTDRSSNRRIDAVFVAWPGKAGIWADSPDEVVHLLRLESQTNQATD
jgi:hypothetical protein